MAHLDKGVYQRKDGRWEARYKRTVNGKSSYASVYAGTREDAIEKRNEVMGLKERHYIDELPTTLNLLILGAGSHGHNVKEIADSLRIFKKVSFLDDFVEGDQIIGKCEEAEQFRNEYACAFVAIGNNCVRKKYTALLKKLGYMMPNIVAPSATLSPRVKLGEGIAILPQSTVNEAEIGDFCILASNSLINNGVKLGAFSHVDCGGIVMKNCVVEPETTVNAGEVFGHPNSAIYEQTVRVSN